MFPEINTKDTFSNIRFDKNCMTNENCERMFKSGKKMFKTQRQRDFNIGKKKKKWSKY